jgi:hypothetical protein
MKFVIHGASASRSALGGLCDQTAYLWLGRPGDAKSMSWQLAVECAWKLQSCRLLPG